MILKTLQRIVQAVNAAPDLSSALCLVVEKVQEALQTDACSVFLADAERGEYILLATIGLNPDAVGKARLRFGQGLVGLVGQRETPINVDNAREHEHYHPIPKVGEDEFHGFMGLPIMHQGELLGILVVQQRDSRFFAEEEEAFLITLCVQLAGEIAHARAKGALQALNKRKRRRIETVISGAPGASGVVIGKALVVYPPADLDAVPDQTAEDVGAEILRFEQALGGAREQIQVLQAKAQTTLSSAETALFDAYARILDSRTLMQEVETEIQEGICAQTALKRVIKQHVLQFESLDDPYLRERASDFRDLGRRILAELQSSDAVDLEYPKQTILVGDEVTATMIMEAPKGVIVGVVSGSGSENSHVAIIARALGLPTVMGVSGTPLSELNGKDLIVDGYNADVYVSPSANLKREFKTLIAEEQQLDESLEALKELPAETKDGHELKLLLNMGLADAGLSLSVGADGVGLYRTEMPFMLRDRFPSEEEQRIMYRQLLNTFSPRQVIMRTLDIGGDKDLPYFPIVEDNPFLGWRGIRVSLDHPEIFIQQVRAMFRASEGLDNLAVMLPMISSVSEVDEALRHIHQAKEELIEEGLDVKPAKIGLMIETPAAVYQIVTLAKRVDFVSVGSNDLIQYLLAVDRNNSHVASYYNGLHPAVLRALYDVAKGAHKAGRKISICGELASDPVAIVLLLGMGYDALSMNARSLPRAKYVIRSFAKDQAKTLLKAVLELDDPREIRNLVETALEEAGLGGLIRAGK